MEVVILLVEVESGALVGMATEQKAERRMPVAVVCLQVEEENALVSRVTRNAELVAVRAPVSLATRNAEVAAVTSPVPWALEASVMILEGLLPPAQAMAPEVAVSPG